MTGRWVRAVTIVTGVATIMVACSTSNGPEPAAPLESAEPITAPPSTEPVATTSTTDAAPDTTAEPAAPTTMSATTSVAPTTEAAPSTTTLEDLRAEIEADLDAAEKAIVALGDDPGSPAAQEGLAELLSGGALERTRTVFRESADQGVRFRSRDDFESFLRVLEDPTVVSPTEVLVLICRIDAAIGYTVASDGSEEISADTIIRTISNSNAVLENGLWKLRGGDRLSRDEDVKSCE